MKGEAGAGVRLGLGCSRFGSLVNGIDSSAAEALVRGALDLGVTLFDTANIYGQGDSEYFLGRALRGRDDAVIVSKGGQVFPLAKRMAIPMKRLLKPLVRRSSRARNAAAGARAAALPRDWSAAHLTGTLEGSLRRLGREWVDIYLLHSPRAEVLREGAAMDTLARLRDAGKARRIGASIDDEDSLEAAIADPRVEVIQLPLSPAFPAMAWRAGEARAQGRMIIAREILGGASIDAEVDAALDFVARQQVDVALLGTRSLARLAHALRRFAEGARC